MKKNSSEKAYDQKQFIAEFIGCDCFGAKVDELQSKEK